MMYECRNMCNGETIAKFGSYEETVEFVDAAADHPDWETIQAMSIVEITDERR